jgi:hypothetical protein
VTTDNGGCREYAIDGETALVVPIRDARWPARSAVSSTTASSRRSSPRTASISSAATSIGNAAPTSSRRCSTGWSPGRVRAPRRDPTRRPEPELSVVVLAWDTLKYTQQFADSVRRHTDVPYELVIVDNGSEWEAANYARAAADRAVLNAENLGFARGMNQGLAAARGRFVAFCNNDTVLPPGWASPLLESRQRARRSSRRRSPRHAIA